MTKIDQPEHYHANKGLAAIDAIEAWELGFHLGNVVKYVARAGRKDGSTKLEDLLKAQWYLAREIEREQHPTPEEIKATVEQVLGSKT